MTHPKEPRRLLDPRSGAHDSVRAVLRAGKSELPGAEELARVRARLPMGPVPPSPPDPPAAPEAGPPAPDAAPGGGPSGAEATGATGAAGAAGGSLIPSVLTGAALAVAVVLGASFRERAAERAAPPVVATSAAIASAPTIAPSAPAPSTVAEAPPAPSPRATSMSTATSIAPALSAPPAAPSAAIEPAASAPETPIPAGGSVAPGDGENEVKLLQRAQDALAPDPARALAIAGEHAQRFPGGALAQERELLAVAALVRLGRAGEARDRASRLIKAFPSSAYRARLEALVGVEAFQKSEGSSPHTP